MNLGNTFNQNANPIAGLMQNMGAAFGNNPGAAIGAAIGALSGDGIMGRIVGMIIGAVLGGVIGKFAGLHHRRCSNRHYGDPKLHR